MKHSIEVTGQQQNIAGPNVKCNIVFNLNCFEILSPTPHRKVCDLFTLLSPEFFISNIFGAFFSYFKLAFTSGGGLYRPGGCATR